MLSCTKCGNEKLPDEMSKDARRKNGLSSWCKDCRKESSRKWVSLNPDKAKESKRLLRSKDGYSSKSRGYMLKHRYGISLEEYEALLDSQDGKCAICNTHQIDKTYYFNVDHCHTTGIVRGLLCSPCNVFLGVIKDDTNALKRAIEYLERNNK